MNAIVLDVSEKKAIVLREDGIFETIKNKKGWEKGLEITLDEKMENAKRRHVRWIFLIFGIFLALGAMFYIWINSPRAFVDILINPAIRLEIDVFGNIRSMEGIDSQGSDFINTLSKSQSMPEGMRSILEHLNKEGYLGEGKDALRVLVSSGEKHIADRIEQELLTISDEYTPKTQPLILQKIPSEDYTKLKKELNKLVSLDPETLQSVYQSDSWKSSTELWIEEINDIGNGFLHVEFTMDSRWFGNEKAYLMDVDGKKHALEIRAQEDDEWLLYENAISAGALYTLEIESENYGKLNGHFRAATPIKIIEKIPKNEEPMANDNAGKPSNSLENNPMNSQTGQETPLPTPPSVLDSPWIQKVDYRKNGHVEIQLSDAFDAGIYHFKLLRGDETIEEAPVRALSDDQMEMTVDVNKNEYCTILLVDAEGNLVSRMPFIADFGYRAERKERNGAITVEISD